MNEYANPNSDMSDDDRVAYVVKHNPDMTADQAADYVSALFGRYEKKQELRSREMSNRMAEKFLDRQGWPRPFGWRTVFVYPDSNSLRWRYWLILAAVVGYFLWSSANG